MGEGCGVLKYNCTIAKYFFFLFKGNQGRFSPLIPKVNVKVVNNTTKTRRNLETIVYQFREWVYHY